MLKAHDRYDARYIAPVGRRDVSRVGASLTSALTAVNQSVTDSDATHSFSVFLKPILVVSVRPEVFALFPPCDCSAASLSAAPLAAAIATAALAAATEPAAVAAASVAERGDRRSALGCQNALGGAN